MIGNPIGRQRGLVDSYVVNHAGEELIAVIADEGVAFLIGPTGVDRRSAAAANL